MDTNERTERSVIVADLARGASWCVWQVIRLPLLAFLVVLEPIVRIALSGFALIGTLTAFLFEFASANENFPFWGMLGMSLSCVGLLWLYHAIIRSLAVRGS